MLTLVEGVFLMVLVPVYWPLINMPWKTTSTAQVKSSVDGTIMTAREPGESGDSEVRDMLISLIQGSSAPHGLEPAPFDGRLRPQTDAATRELPKTNAGRAQVVLLRRIQGRLAQLEFDPGPSDGQLGPRTAAALRQFQAMHGLGITGEVDSETLAALGRVSQRDTLELTPFRGHFIST